MKRFAIFALISSLTLVVSEGRADVTNVFLVTIGSTEAGKWISKQLVVTGVVAQVRVRPNLVFLNFDEAYSSDLFTAIIRNKNTKEFVNLSALRDEAVSVKGQIKDCNGRPEMVLTGESQLEVLNK